MIELTGKQIKIAIAAIVLLGLIIKFNPITSNDSGYRQVVENKITGNTWVQFEQGIYIKGPGSKITTYPDVLTVKYSKKYADEDNNEDISSLNAPVDIRFSDAADADAEATVKFRLPATEQEMLLLHRDNRNYKKLTQTILEPYADECLNFSAQLMESETHYSGGKSKMAEDFQSQLEKGQYIIEVKSEYVEDSISNTKRRITETNIRRNADGTPSRKKSNILQYGITIAAATIESVDYDPLIDKKLEAKIDASTRESISKQLAITAEQEAITAARQGEKLIAETEAREQSAKREAVIQAEKKTAVAVENKKQAILNAEAELATKTAQAKGDRLKVAAGLSPKEKAEFDMKTKIGVAAEIAKRPVPLITNNGAGASGLSQTYSMQEMLVLVDKISSSKVGK